MKRYKIIKEIFVFKPIIMFLLRDVQPQSPFSMMVAGPSGSAKTFFVRKLLEHYSILILGNTNYLKVIWCYGQWQPGYLNPVSNVSIEYIDGLVSEAELDEEGPNLIVIEDLMNELSDDVRLGNLFTKFSHYKNMNVIFISQNVFHQGRQMRNIHLSCHYLLLIKNSRDRLQINRLGTQIKIRKALAKAYNDASADPFSYLPNDFEQDTHFKLFLRARILPEKTIKLFFRLIIYEIK